jgi:hypothetical protein
MKGDFSRSTFRSEKHYSHVLIEQGRVQVDADWNEQQEILQHRIRTEALDLIGTGATSIKNNGFMISLSADGKAIQIGKGRIYVDGIVCENESDVAFGSQPDFPTPPDPFQGLASAGIVYLDVWQRHVTALDDPHIREVALNGADTSTRAKTVWQVKVLPIAGPGTGLNPGNPVPEWDALTAGSTGMLNARTQPTQSTNNPPLIPPTAGYLSLENQLYRVEIHKPGALQPGGTGTATFKWSRNNGSVETRIMGISSNQVTVHDLGPDEVLGFANGQTVELLADHHDLYNVPGQLLTINSVSTATNTVTLNNAPNAADLDLTLHPRMRLWDSADELNVAIPATNDGWISLENGIQIQFVPGTYNTGDYWLIPARTVTGEIDWPPFAIPNTNPIAQPPAGIRHHYCRLALLQAANITPKTWQLTDWRNFFPALADVPSPDGGIHVTALILVDRTTGNPSSALVNDTSVQVASFGGINIVCDADVEPMSIARPTCFLSVEEPVQLKPPAGPGAGYWALNLAGALSTSPNTISWRPTPDAATLLDQIVEGTPAGDRGILARLTLKGNFIWARQNRNLYLDGETFGDFHDGAPNIFLKLPSGDKRRGGDFEMWFWLVAAPATLSDLQVPAQLIAGTTVQATIKLTNNAPAAGFPVTITVTSTPPNLLTAVPTTITVPAGAAAATFAIQAALNVAGQATITASVPGVAKAGTLNVVPLTVTGTLDITPPSITVDDKATGTFHLSAPAPSPTVVSLASTNAAIATVAANVTVPAGNNSAQFDIQGKAPGNSTITATLGGVTLQNTITVVPRKPKEKEKEHKDKDKDVKEKELHGLEHLPVAFRPLDIASAEPGASAIARAFIQPVERPPV